MESGVSIQVVFVCTGNTCRSPMAAVLFERHVQREPTLAAKGVRVRSAGLQASTGKPAAEGAVRAVRAVGLSLTGHRARPFDNEMAASDLILTMTEAHKSEIILKYPQVAANLFTLKEYARLGGSPYISDPYGQDDSVYLSTLYEIDRAVAKAVQRLADEGMAK